MSTKQILLAIALAILVGLICNAQAQTISTKSLVAGTPIKIALNPGLTTTLLFPSQISGAIGLGLVTGANSSNTGGSVQVEHPDGSQLLVLHALTENAHVLATVLLDGVLYVFDLQSSQQPDVAVTLVKGGSVQDPAGIAPRAVAVTEDEIKAARPKYDTEILIGLLRRARDHDILAPIYHDLYAGYSKKDVFFTSDSGSVKTVVTTVHRFSKEDAVVLQGTVENEGDQPLTFDGRAATVLCANEVHPVKLLDCLRPIPAHTKTLIDVVLQGDVDGGRANLSVENEYRIELGSTPIWRLKNGSSPGPGGFKIAPPLKQVPLARTGATQ